MKKDNHKTSARPEPYLTASEVARICNVSTKSVYRWGENGFVPVYRAGRQLRFRRDDVERYLARDLHRERAVAHNIWR